MNRYWLGEMKIPGQPRRVVLFDNGHQSVSEGLVKLFVSELGRCITYSKGVIRPYLKSINPHSAEGMRCKSLYRALRSSLREVTWEEPYQDSFVEDAYSELRSELDDDAEDYTRSNEDGWFYSDGDDALQDYS